MSATIRRLPVLVSLAALAALPGTVSAQRLEQRIVHPAPLGAANDETFGRAVDISGDALIVGASGNSTTLDHLHSGCAIYERVGGTWSLAHDELQQFPPEQFAGYDVALDGAWAAFPVLDPLHLLPAQGAVHVLHRDAGGWVETQILTSPTPGAGDPDLFGISVDISGTLMAVGSAGQETVFVFRLSGGSWAFETGLDAPAGYVQASSGFGAAVAVAQSASRESVLVGQPFFDLSASFTDDDGAAHAFVQEDFAGWQLATTVPPTAAPSLKSSLGHSVALDEDGDVAVVGAVWAGFYAPPFTLGGAALVLRWDVGGFFAPSATLSGDVQEYFGYGLAAQGDRVYAGSIEWPGIDQDLSSEGRVVGRRWTGSAWTAWPANGGSFHRVEAPLKDMGFGYALAASGGRLVVGAPGAAPGGAICVLDVATEAWKWSDAQLGGLDTVVGSTGPARLIGEGSLGAGDGHRIHLHDARPSTLIAMFVGLTAINVPFKTGILVPNPQYLLWFATNPAGDFHVTTKFPNGVPPGIPIWHHMWWPDPAAPAGFASSNAIRGITP